MRTFCPLIQMLAAIRMTERTFIEDQKLVSKMLDDLDSTGVTSGYGLELYVNPKDGQSWERYEFELDGNNVFGLRKHPYPNTDKIIEITVNSKFMDEVDGACALLHHLEWNNRTEFRERLLNELRITRIEKLRFEIIYERAELSDSSNKRDVLGKTIDEIETDAQYFLNLTKQVNELKNEVTAANKTYE
jgi:hypothetical protein